MIDDHEFGWGSAEPSRGLAAVSAAALVVASGLYCVSAWLASGLQPLPYLAARAPRPKSPEGAEAVR